jgi:hypothetical protein
MRQAVVVFGLFIGLSLMSGCGGDPVEKAVQNIISQMDAAQAKMGAVADALQAAIKKAKDQNRPVEKKDLTSGAVDVGKALDELHEVGTALVAQNDNAQQLKGKVTPEQAKALQAQYQQSIKAKVNDLDTTWKRLKDLMQQFKANADSDATAFLDDRWRAAMADFEALTRQK